MSANYEMPLEKDFQTVVLKKLREIPGTWWMKVNDRTTNGLPDILGSVAGVFFAIELKTKSKLAPIQAYTLRRIDRSGGQTFVCTPDTFPDLLAYVKKIALLGHVPAKEKAL